MTCILFYLAAAAFELQSDSPWLSGAAAAALFPRSYMAITVNPAASGLIGEFAVSVSASRPFGFSELDRTAVAAGISMERAAAAGYLSVSGRNGYLETTATGSGAFTLSRGLVAGGSFSWHYLSIDEYGAASAVSADLGIVARPVNGFFLGASSRGIFSSALADDNMGAVPRSVHGSAGVCPARGITISAGASFHQYAGAEYSAVTSVEPFPGFVIAVSVLTPPARIGFSIQASVHNTALQYGYSTHPVLPAGHSVGVTYGTSGFRPSALVSYVSSDPSSVEFPVNLNTASDTQLVQIPGIGPSTASLIINYRNEHGLFQSVEQLLDVPGIGNATLESLKPYLTI